MSYWIANQINLIGIFNPKVLKFLDGQSNMIHDYKEDKGKESEYYQYNPDYDNDVIE